MTEHTDPDHTNTEHTNPEPTTPLPMSAPTSGPATHAAPTPARSGGTGRGWRGWPRAAVVAVLAACLLAVGGVAFGVTMAAARTSGATTSASPAAAPSAPATPTTPGAGAGGGTGAGKHHHVRVRGTITAISGNVWTLRTKHGSVSVTIAAATAFGTKKAPGSRTQFAVGQPATVVAAKGTAAGATSLTAARVTPPQPKHAKGSSKSAAKAKASPSTSSSNSTSGTAAG